MRREKDETKSIAMVPVSQKFLVFLFFVNALNISYSQGLSIIDGEWINEEYARVLKDIRSPKEAYRVGEPFFITITKGVITWGVHDVSTARMDGKAKDGRFQTSTFKRSDGTIVFLSSENKIKWTTIKVPNGRPVSMTFYRPRLSTEDELRSIVLAGKYVDQQGRLYEFTPDGDARWPSQSFHYRIGLDYSWDAPCFFHTDQFISGEGWNTVGFQWEDGTLLLFKKTLGTEEQPMGGYEAKPFVILTKRK